MSGHPAWTAQVIEESIQVSITSLSPLNSFEPHWGHLLIRGFSNRGSTGIQLSSASIILSHFLQYQIGIGVAKIRCLDITQSQSRDVAQFMSLFFA